MIANRIYPKYSDRQVWANGVESEKTSQNVAFDPRGVGALIIKKGKGVLLGALPLSRHDWDPFPGNVRRTYTPL